MLNWKQLTTMQKALIIEKAKESFKLDCRECHSDYLTVSRQEALNFKVENLVSYYFDYLRYEYDQVPSDTTLGYIGEEVGSYIFYHCGVCNFSF